MCATSVCYPIITCKRATFQIAKIRRCPAENTGAGGTVEASIIYKRGMNKECGRYFGFFVMQKLRFSEKHK